MTMKQTCLDCGTEHPKDPTDTLCAACGSFFGPCCVCQSCGAKRIDKTVRWRVWHKRRKSGAIGCWTNHWAYFNAETEQGALDRHRETLHAAGWETAGGTAETAPEGA